MRYYLSLDGLKDGGDVLLSKTRRVPALAAGTPSIGTVTVTIPSSAPLDTYFLLACADDMGAVAETDRTNNCRSSETMLQVTLPDLVVTELTNPPGAALPGDRFLVTDTVENQGLVPARNSTVRYYLSLDEVKDSGDVLLRGSRGVSPLAAGAWSTGTVTVTIPSSTALGTYFLLACADDRSRVAETDKTNNCRASDAQVKVGP